MSGLTLSSHWLVLDEPDEADIDDITRSHPLSWHGELHAGEDRREKAGWPA